MKNFILSLLALAIFFPAFAQSPEKFTYQAVVRDANGALVSNGAVGVQISILQGSATGSVVYSETHAVITNDNGLVSLQIGEGAATSGTFSGIDWKNGPYFLESSTDPAGGTNFSITGTSELSSVPFALFSSEADSASYAEKATNAAFATDAQNANFADSSNVAAFAYNTPAQTKSILITPGMISTQTFNGGVTLAQAPTYRPCIDMPEGAGTVEFSISIPAPTDYKGTTITARMLYTSTTNTGNFDLRIGIRGAGVGEDLTPFTSSFSNPLASPSNVAFLQEHIQPLPNSNLNQNTKMIQILIRRSSQSSNDTSTGTLKFLGLVLEYEN